MKVINDCAIMKEFEEFCKRNNHPSLATELRKIIDEEGLDKFMEDEPEYDSDDEPIPEPVKKIESDYIRDHKVLTWLLWRTHPTISNPMWYEEVECPDEAEKLYNVHSK